MINIEAPIANSLRRIMIAEVLIKINIYRFLQWQFIKFK